MSPKDIGGKGTAGAVCGCRIGPWINDAESKDNQYLYNGKELNTDFGLDMLDYGARWYDPSIARWHNVDPLAEKYSPISPFTYVANNPIMFIDRDGMQIDLPGDKEAQNEYLSMLNSSTGNIYKLDGNTLVLVGANEDFTGNKSKTLIDIIQKGIDSKDTYTHNLVGANGDDEGVFIDSYTEGKIDVSDLSKLGETSTALQGAAIGHFLNEILASDGYSSASAKGREALFDDAHESSLKAEGRIFGELVGDNSITSRTTIPGVPSGNTQSVVYQFNSSNRFRLKQGATSKSIQTTMKVNGVDFPISETTVVPTGKLKSVKKIK